MLIFLTYITFFYKREFSCITFLCSTVNNTHTVHLPVRCLSHLTFEYVMHVVVIRKCSVKILLPITIWRLSSTRHKHASARGIIISSSNHDVACHTVDGQQNAVIYILIRSTFRLVAIDRPAGMPLK